jgi:glutamate/tyrosine decarboxylase-like PLP-dependent enzyme
MSNKDAMVTMTLVEYERRQEIAEHRYKELEARIPKVTITSYTYSGKTSAYVNADLSSLRGEIERQLKEKGIDHLFAADKDISNVSMYALTDLVAKKEQEEEEAALQKEQEEAEKNVEEKEAVNE